MKLNEKTLENLRVLINEEIEYRSGPKLVEFFNLFGFNDTYEQGFPSRWKYTYSKLNELNDSFKIKECILQLFNSINFIEDSDRLDFLIENFNKYLSFDDYDIKRNENFIDIVDLKKDVKITIDVKKALSEYLSKNKIIENIYGKFKVKEQLGQSKIKLQQYDIRYKKYEGLIKNLLAEPTRPKQASKTWNAVGTGSLSQQHYYHLTAFLGMQLSLGNLKETQSSASHFNFDYAQSPFYNAPPLGGWEACCNQECSKFKNHIDFYSKIFTIRFLIINNFNRMFNEEAYFCNPFSRNWSEL